MDNDKLYIEDFSYYLNGRNSGHIKVICPLCHEQRSNKKDKSLSIDCSTLAYKCHYCGASGYLKSRTQESIQRINREVKHMPKTYRKPSTQPNIQTTLDDGVVAYFKGRGISEQTLFDAKVTKETYYFPQDSAKRGCIAFNYYVDGEHVNTKYRTRDKHFTFIGGAKVVPYNLDSIAEKAYSDGEQRYCIITEGECFDEDAQVLTQSGCWKKIKDLESEDEVAQWENGIITFAKPLAIVRKQYEGNMVELYSHRGNYTSFTTPLHNLVVERNGIIKKCHAIDIHSQINIPRNGIYNGVGIPLSEERLRLLIAISADFTIREKGDLYACFKKERKIERIKMLLEQNNLRYTAYKSSRDGYVDFYVHRHQIQAYKEFPNEWLYLASKEQIRIMLEELVLWDGNSVNNRTMKEYNTKLYHNAVWVQTLCHLGGMMSTITYRENKHGKWYKVSLLKKSFSSISSNRKRLVPYKGMVYCCTMPKGTLLVRQNENITVSGNCDTLTYLECGYKHVISMPAGANANLEWMDDYVESHFDKLEIIYVSTDGDKKGIEAKNELVRRFGAEMCKVVEYPDGCKDINEVLVKYGREKVIECFDNAYDVKPQGIEELYDVQTDLDYLFHNGLQKGATINIPDVDNILSFKTGMLTVVTGVPSHGKALSLNTPLPTPNGWTTMGEVKVGDELYDEQGNICKVTYTTPIQYNRNCYKIFFSDGSEIICDEDHLWVTRDDKARRSAYNHLKRIKKNGTDKILPRGTDQSYKRSYPKERTTKEIINTLYVENGKRCNHAVAVQGKLCGVAKDIELYPYILGVWLAEGTTHHGSITTGDIEIIEKIKNIGFKVSKRKDKYAYGIYGLRTKLRNVGVLDNKRIPRLYMRLPYEDRLELMKGMMDGDGTCAKDGTCSYSTSIKELADDFYELAMTMGLKATITSKRASYNGVKKKVNYSINFRPNFKCFTLERKNSRIHEKYADDVNWRYIRKIEKVESVPVKCIQVDSLNHMYLCGKSMIPTHNTYMLNYFLSRLNILNDWKIAFFSPEFYPVTLHISQIIETLGGARFNAQNYNQRTYEVLKEYVNNNFFWIDPDDTDINSVLERGKYLIRKKGIRAFVIDPFNALTDKERTTQKQDEYISEFLQKIRWFARKYDVALFLVMHPTKQQKLESGLYPVVDLYACKGASEIYDKADIGITVWRNEQANYAEMHVTKMKFRHLGEKGHATFVFNINNGRYVSIPNTDGKAIFINPNEIAWDNSNYVTNKIDKIQEQQSISFTNDNINVEQEELDPLGFPIAGEAPF